MVPRAALMFILLLALCSPTGAVSVVPVSQDHYTCYDYSVKFAENNTGWGIVTVSDNQWFKGTTHTVNYKIVTDNILQIHDGMRNADYLVGGWEKQGYYHFWVNETPRRNYHIMQDNRQKLISLFPQERL